MVWWMKRVWTMWKDGNSLIARLPWLTLLTGVAALLIFLGPVEWALGLQLDRGDLGIRSAWQLFTGHLIHWNANHLIWDIAVFGTVGSLVEMRSRSDWLGLCLASAVAISISFLVWVPDLQFYRGLSGIDMALVGFWMCSQLRESPRKLRWMWRVGLMLVIAKPLIEIILGQALFVSDLGTGVRNVPLAHLVGVSVGIFFSPINGVRRYQFSVDATAGRVPRT